MNRLFKILVFSLVVNGMLIAQDIQPGKLQSLIKQSTQSLEAGAIDSASYYLEQFLIHHPDDRIDSLYVDSQMLLARITMAKGQNKEAVQILDELQPLPDTSLPVHQRIRVLLIRGQANMMDWQLDVAEDEVRRAMKWIQESNLNDLLYGAYMTLGMIKHRQYETREAIKFVELALEEAQKQFDPTSIQIAKIYGNLAICYSDLRDYENALAYLYKDYEIHRALYGENGFELRNLYFNFGHILQEKNQYEEAILHYKRSLRIYLQYAPDNYYVFENYRRLGQCTQELGFIDSVHYYYQLGISQLENDVEGNALALAQFNNSYGNFYMSENQYYHAINRFQSAYEFGKMALNLNHPWLSTYLRSMATAYAYVEDFHAAKSLIDTALQNVGYNPALDPNEIIGEQHLYNILADAALIYLSWYDSEQEILLIDTAMQFLDAALIIHENLLKTLVDPDAKISLRNEAQYLYTYGMECAYLLYQDSHSLPAAENCLKWSELSKQSIVLESIRSKNARLVSTIPQNITIRENSLKEEIANLMKSLDSRSTQDSLYQQVRIELFARKRELFDLIDSIYVAYPDYYELIYPAKFSPLQKIVKTLDPGEVLVEYFDVEEYTYIFGISVDTMIIHRIPVSDQMEKDLATLLSHVNNPDSILPDVGHSFEVFRKASSKVYKILLDSLLSIQSGNRLIIVPDYREAYIPFEVLLPIHSGNGASGKFSFLMENYSISYAQSINMYLEQRGIKSNTSGLFAGFAPVFESEFVLEDTIDKPQYAVLVRSGDYHLPGAQNEVKAIQQLIGGDLFIGAEANIDNVKKIGKRASILHFSTHALIDPQDPSRSELILYPALESAESHLTSADICLMDLRADLVVLSACRTGYGLVHRSEGVMSLGRSFAYAGIPSTVMSLWKIPDQTTSEIIPTFYEGLKNGLSKADALNYARKSYLDNTHIQELKHPYYWAGFVLYGNSDPVEISQSNYFGVFWILGLSILLVAFFLYRKRNSSKKSNQGVQ